MDGNNNSLQRHERLVRMVAGDREHGHEKEQLEPLLHERCCLLVRDGLGETAIDLVPPTVGRQAVLRSGSLWPSVRVLRLEPAELLPNGDTRAHWQDGAGGRHAQTARWSDDGRLLRLILVKEPPPTHREWLEAVLQQETHRTPSVRTHRPNPVFSQFKDPLLARNRIHECCAGCLWMWCYQTLVGSV